MSEGDLIPAEPTLKWLGYTLNVQFYPSIRLKRSVGLQFAEELSDWLEPEDIHIVDGNEWRLFGSASCEGMQLHVAKQSIQIQVAHPTNNLEWYERRFAGVLNAFRATFTPQLALRSRGLVSALLPMNVDTLPFMGGYVMMMHPKKLRPLERPLHVLGVRLYFPPYTDPVEDGSDIEVDWGVDVRVETAIDDDHALFLEADSDWETTSEWTDQHTDELVRRIGISTAFVADKLIKFLRQPPWSLEDDDDDTEE